ncbi:MAG: hypothetical protein Q8R53_02945, partial [Nanoarchaeota archaeon]|nr:hypothetical protein [Nanoarchaeota archaeon]
MAEQHPQYSLEVILNYDEGSLTFTASSDNPLVVLHASLEMPNLNGGWENGYDARKVVVTLYKDGQPLERSALASEVTREYLPK